MSNMHTVILGAGATVAAIPNGDKYGNESSVMNGLIKKLHLEDIVSGVDIHTKSNNLEDIYSELYLRPECKSVVKNLENILYDYFASLELPDQPTIYDFLVLSLTKKDVIATFNWDPLLVQAYVRCHRITSNLPHILCLHGNTAIGYCYEHDEFGTTEATCPICGRVFAPTKLLYPVKVKGYDKDNYIKKCWESIDYCLEHSYMLTIFGYSAPSSDKQAVSLLKKAWGSLDERQFEEVSVIDIIEEESMLEKWKDFIYSHHYRYTNDFYSSYLGTFPRRTCETIFATFQLCLPPYDNRGFKEGMSWDDIKSFIQPLLKEELETPNGKGYPLHFHGQ